jgi:HAD superfamily hydrolase (TIGR01549 family)
VGARTSDYIVASLQIRVTDRERSELQRLVEDLNREPRYLSAEGALGALRYLKGRGVGVGIVSNRSSNPAWLVMRQLEAAGLAQFFDPAAIAWSDRVGWRKPDPRLFLYSLGALGASPSRAAHVGNSKLKDVRGARALGMMTVRYAGIRDERGDGPEADVVIRRYDELAEVLGLAGTAAERTVARAERESQS